VAVASTAPRWGAVASLAAGAILAIALYVAAFGSGSVHSLGTDAAGYVVQMRGAASGVFDFQGSRPGTAAAGAFLTGIGVVPAGAAPIVISVALAAILGLAAAVTLRSVANLPAWASGVVVLLVATWGGTARLASGYLANLLSLTLFLLAVHLALTSRSRVAAVPVLLVGVACFLAHPGLVPAYLTIAVGWVVAGLVRRRPGTSLRDGEALATTVALLGAAAIVAVIVFGPLNLTVRDLADFTFAQDRFEERAADFVRWMSPGLTAALVVFGVLICLVPAGIRTPAAASRLGIVWLGISAAGLAILHVMPSQPGHRTLLLGVPVPMLAALLVVGAAKVLIERIRPDGWARTIASGSVLTIAIAAAVAIAVTTLRPFEAKASTSAPPTDRTASVSAMIAGYLRAVRSERPVILVANPSPEDPMRWKGRQNQVRSLAPDGMFLRTVVYLGDERNLLRGVPTFRRGPGSELFNLASVRTWAEVEDVLADDPIILVARRWVVPRVWDRVSPNALPSTPGIAVVSGPVPASLTPVGEQRLPAADAGIRIVGLVLLLGVLGAGWSDRTLRGRAGPADRIALAPAFGLCLVVLVAIAVAVMGGDPAGPFGLAAVALLAGIGWLPPGIRARLDGRLRPITLRPSWDRRRWDPRSGRDLTPGPPVPAFELASYPSSPGGTPARR
jgi:hypothetical protein